LVAVVDQSVEEGLGDDGVGNRGYQSTGERFEVRIRERLVLVNRASAPARMARCARARAMWGVCPVMVLCSVLT
jgi:hypothetical protein